MRPEEVFLTALKSLGINKIRTVLTMLGVIIGVFAVVSLTSLVKGVQNYVTDQFNSLGSNLISVAPGRFSMNRDPASSFTNNKLDIKQVDDIERYAANYIDSASPMIELGRTIKYKNIKYYSSVVGTSYTAAKSLNLTVDYGSFFSKADQDGKVKAVVLGNKVTKELFGTDNPVGKSIKIDNISFTVIGVAAQKSTQFDKMVLLPYTTVEDSLGIKVISAFMVKAKSNVDINVAMRQVELALLKSLKKDDFTVISSKDILSSANKILGVLSTGLAAIAGISLLVGGIGIMNIMLVSVTERTNEIGLRKALGATPFVIGIQFIIEAILISVTGGFLGLGLGWLLTVATRSLLRSEVPWWAALLSMGFSLIVGVGFGAYPTIQASKKDPIESLRHE